MKTDHFSIIPYTSYRPKAGISPVQLEAAPNIVTTLLRKKYAGFSPREINAGNCDHFAQDLAAQLGGEICETDFDKFDGPMHFFVKLNNHYFDAECPCGVSQLKDLPIFQRWFAGLARA